MPTLFVVVPYFNEPATLAACITRVVDAPLPPGWERQVVLVDDASAPPGRAAADEVVRRHAGTVTLLRHERNAGKGAALMTGFDWVLGREGAAGAVLIHDADLEYDPADHAVLVGALTADPLVAVFGNRWHQLPARTTLRGRLHRAGNGALTALSNAVTGLSVSDMECCSKLMSIELLRQVRPWLSERRFGIEPQLTATIARLGGRVKEVPIRYEARGFRAGKKIGPRDGLRALWVIVRERLR